MTGPEAFEPLIDKFEVARRLHVHFATIERLIRTDDLPVIRLGAATQRQMLRFRWSDVRAWCARRTAGAV